ncbi:unnamed protein product [Brugia pahangi]|uniref:Recep_L_domain domain-containing protein n=1 Tax=Brugia pahangi TaxID=6280 RepID=A0A0N4TRD4_BRUPA|nr:unnamed protein product [Brugia pahangi]
MQIFLNELKICKQKGDKMEAFVTDNRSLTIIQNHSFHLPSNLTKSIKEFNIILKNITVPNNECVGMVLDASLNYININILLLCYEKNRTLEFWEKTVVLLILVVAFICFLITAIKGIQWLCGKKKPIFAHTGNFVCLKLNSDHLRFVLFLSVKTEIKAIVVNKFKASRIRICLGLIAAN